MRLFVLVLLSVWSVSVAATNSALKRFAQEIVRRQLPDGAIVLNRVAPADYRAVPYFANLYHRLVARCGAMIPAQAKTEENIEHLVWWGYAAKAAGDAPRLYKIQSALAAVDLIAIPIADTALLGHVCRLLANN